MKKIWVTRDEESDALYVWTGVEPVKKHGEWDLGGEHCDVSCGDAQLFIKALLGNQWRKKGPLALELTIASIEKIVTPEQKLAATLRGMTKTTFKKSTLTTVAKLLDGK